METHLILYILSKIITYKLHKKKIPRRKVWQPSLISLPLSGKVAHRCKK